MVIKIGDRVRHKATGLTGQVIGYGKRQVANSSYSTTLKVELQSSGSIRPMAEDVISKWKISQDKRVIACTLPHFPKRSLSKIG